MSLLQLSNVRVRYGSVEVLHGIDLKVDEGEIVTILGANGAGKSTTLLSISGLVRPFEGEILFEGQNLLRLPSHKVVGLGIAQSPEGRRVFRHHERSGKSAPRGLLYRRQSPAASARWNGIFDLFSAFARTQGSTRGHAFWRRAANARHRPRPHGRAAPSAAG